MCVCARCNREVGHTDAVMVNDSENTATGLSEQEWCEDCQEEDSETYRRETETLFGR
jgi:hypothetical protein